MFYKTRVLSKVPQDFSSNFFLTKSTNQTHYAKVDAIHGKTSVVICNNMMFLNATFYTYGIDINNKLDYLTIFLSISIRFVCFDMKTNYRGFISLKF
jgi:hypothetical protein